MVFSIECTFYRMSLRFKPVIQILILSALYEFPTFLSLSLQSHCCNFLVLKFVQISGSYPWMLLIGLSHCFMSHIIKLEFLIGLSHSSMCHMLNILDTDWLVSLFHVSHDCHQHVWLASLISSHVTWLIWDNPNSNNKYFSKLKV